MVSLLTKADVCHAEDNLPDAVLLTSEEARQGRGKELWGYAAGSALFTLWPGARHFTHLSSKASIK